MNKKDIFKSMGIDYNTNLPLDNGNEDIERKERKRQTGEQTLKAINIVINNLHLHQLCNNDFTFMQELQKRTRERYFNK